MDPVEVQESYRNLEPVSRSRRACLACSARTGAGSSSARSISTAFYRPITGHGSSGHSRWAPSGPALRSDQGGRGSSPCLPGDLRDRFAPSLLASKWLYRLARIDSIKEFGTGWVSSPANESVSGEPNSLSTSRSRAIVRSMSLTSFGSIPAGRSPVATTIAARVLSARPANSSRPSRDTSR